MPVSCGHPRAPDLGNAAGIRGPAYHAGGDADLHADAEVAFELGWDVDPDDPAVFVHLGMPLTFVPTAAAGGHASSSGRVRLASYSVWRLATRSVAVHTSAQSRSRRRHLVSSATFCSTQAVIGAAV
jgi:hypothetical protein